MSRKDDLERNIRESYEIIRQYEAILQTGQPEEKLRAQRVMEQQWELVEGYIGEYRNVAGDILPADIAEIAAHFEGRDKSEQEIRQVEEQHANAVPNPSSASGDENNRHAQVQCAAVRLRTKLGNKLNLFYWNKLLPLNNDTITLEQVPLFIQRLWDEYLAFDLNGLTGAGSKAKRNIREYFESAKIDQAYGLIQFILDNDPDQKNRQAFITACDSVVATEKIAGDKGYKQIKAILEKARNKTSKSLNDQRHSIQKLVDIAKKSLWLWYIGGVLASALGFVASLVDVFGLTPCLRFVLFAVLAFLGGASILLYSFIQSKTRYEKWDRWFTAVLCVLATVVLSWFAYQTCTSGTPPIDTVTPTSTNTVAPTFTPTPTSTSSPTPTATFTPTNTPTPQPAQVEVIGETVNVRSGPGESCLWITSVNQGETYPIVGTNADKSWWQICCLDDDSQGWISGGLVNTVGETDNVPIVETTPCPTPTPTPILVADFSTCEPPNNLGGGMGASYNAPDNLQESYPQESGRGCVARLEYNIEGWSAFWLKLQQTDLSQYSRLVFDIRAEPPFESPREFKIELKRGSDENVETSITYVSGITTDWRRRTVNIQTELEPFGDAGLSAFTNMTELVFTFESSRSGSSGIVYLDNIVFER